MVVVLILGIAGAGFVVLASAGGSVRPVSESTLSPKPAPVVTRSSTAPTMPTFSQREGAPQKERQMPGWVAGLFQSLFWLVLAALGVFLGLLIYRIVRRVQLPTVTESDPDWERIAAEKLAEAVDSGLAAIDSGRPTDAVIACWVALEQAAASAGVAREASETPAEFTVRVLGVGGISEPELVRLGELYREARYSTHGSGESSRAEARAALLRLRDDLAAAQAGGRVSAGAAAPDNPAPPNGGVGA
ncbi:DUF4129 domain-containing protein [Kribbella antibiotica]|uniref:DUF4129 domain-containing protein n=1 Tax=Kribbella antibiotica TaxID=190195 RepID=A0A4V2YQ36_9ACTN|nr:DUF4129 domain-containing protein [Kribbella antibiotica]